MGGMLTELDASVGSIVDILKTSGLYENSVVTFACDNGGPLPHSTNAPLRGGKHTLWEGVNLLLMSSLTGESPS